MLSTERFTGRASGRVHGANVGGRMQKKCGYCRKAIEGKPVVSTLLYLQGNQLARKEKEYCSERCASHDQMAHEG